MNDELRNLLDTLVWGCCSTAFVRADADDELGYRQAEAEV
jgi:hypothetical protein